MEAKVTSRNALPSLKVVIIYLGTKIQPDKGQYDQAHRSAQLPPQNCTQCTLQHYSVSSDPHTAGHDLLVQTCILLRPCSSTAGGMA